MPEPASVFPETFDLGKHLVWSPGKDIAARHLLIQPGSQRQPCTTAGALHNLGRHRRWVIAWGITPMLRHFVRGHVPEHFFRPGTSLRRIVAYIDQRRIGQAVKWRLLAVGRTVGVAIPIVDLTNAWVAS